MTSPADVRQIANSTINLNTAIAELEYLLHHARAQGLDYTTLHLEEARAAVEQARTQVRYAILAAEESR